MMEMLQFLSILLLVLIFVQNVAIYRRLTRRDEETALDERVQESMDEEARLSRAMSEGMDNLMRFSVRGQDGFGGDS